MKHNHDKCEALVGKVVAPERLGLRPCGHRRSSHDSKRGCAFCKCKAFVEPAK